MGGGAPAAPTPPDPYKTASAQSTANAQDATAQAALNNVNQYTPYGSTTYSQTGTQLITNPDGSTTTVPTFTSTQKLSPAEQNLFNQQTQLGSQENTVAKNALTNIGGVLSNPLTGGQLPGLKESLGATPAMQTGYNQGGSIANQYGSGGQIQSGVGVQQAGTGFGQTQNNVSYMSNQDFSGETNDATNAVLARLQPSMAQSTAALQSQLANQGVTAGSSAYNDAMLQQAGANNDLRLGAVQTGDQEQQALFGEAAQQNQLFNAAQQQDYNQQQGRGMFGLNAMAQNNAANLAAGQFTNAAQQQGNSQNAQAAAFYDAAQGQQNSENAQQAAFGNAAQQQQFQNTQAADTFQNQAREQSLSDQMQLRNAPINEISSLMNGGQVTNGSYQGYNAAQLGQTPISQDVYQSANLEEQTYQQQMQAAAQNNSAMFSALGGLFGMGGKMFGASDRRLKKNVVALGRASNGLPAYRFHYVWDADDDLPTFGHMADEVAEVRPDAVYRMPNGFDAVAYGVL